MKILALIPARGGSKRLPRKNLKMLGNAPLIAWTIRAAQQSQACVDIMVSTDDPEIAEVSRRYGAYVPGLRPDELATDTASSVDVTLHALATYEDNHGAVDGLLLLQPTSPFRTANSICAIVEKFRSDPERHAIVSVSAAGTHPAWCFKISSDAMAPFFGWDGINRRSQDLEPVFALNGALYLVTPQDLRRTKAFVFEGIKPFLMNEPTEGHDIDTPLDWAVAEAIMRLVYENGVDESQ